MLSPDPSVARLDIVPAESILPHEIADPGREQRIEDRLSTDGVLRDPLLVGGLREMDRYVLLDGTNRRRALAALEVPWTMVQIIDYADQNAVELRTWCHTTPIPLATLLSGVSTIDGVRVSPVAALETAEAIRSAGTLAVVLDGVQTAALTLDSGFTGSRTEILRQFVDLYEETLTRVTCEPDEVEERARALCNGGTGTLIAFPRFSRSQVVTMATRQLMIPAGITRHVILCGRALRVNLPLNVLRNASLDGARQQLEAHIRTLQPRVYRETTILYDS